MPRIPIPLIWKRRNFAVLEDLGMVDRLTALATSGIVSGPFAIYPSPYGSAGPFTLIHLPSQAKIIDLRRQSACRDGGEVRRPRLELVDLQSGGGHRPRLPGDAEHPRAPEAGPLDRQRLGEGGPVKTVRCQRGYEL